MLVSQFLITMRLACRSSRVRQLIGSYADAPHTALGRHKVGSWAARVLAKFAERQDNTSTFPTAKKLQ